jgi:hypothetical protein
MPLQSDDIHIGDPDVISQVDQRYALEVEDIITSPPE